jgi:hypothetical protein
MPLKSIVIEAKRNTPEQKQFDPSKPITNFIDATQIQGIGVAIESETAKWEECKALKQSGERCFCTMYTSLCAKEKCPTKFRPREQ